MTKYNNIRLKSLQYPYNTLIFQHKYLKHTIALHFTDLLTKKTAKQGQQIEFTTKHRMFSLKVYPSPENFTQPLAVMVVTFSKSGLSKVGVLSTIILTRQVIQFLPYMGFFLLIFIYLTLKVICFAFVPGPGSPLITTNTCLSYKIKALQTN